MQQRAGFRIGCALLTRVRPFKALPSLMKSLRRNRVSSLAALIGMLLLVQACTNSPLIISPLYNRLDDRMRDAFNDMADFNQQQSASFEATLGTFHVWHRQSELPQYAKFLDTVAQSIASSSTDEQDIQQWFDEAEQRSVLIRQCHPINFSIQLMKSLSDVQVVSIENEFARELQEDRDRYEKLTPEDRVKRRLRNITKWANRIDMEITATQRAMLLSTFKRQISLRKEYFALSEQWNDEFVSLLRERDKPDFENNMQVHLDNLWQQLERAHPEQWQTNRNLWKQTGLRFVQSMTDEQRVTLSRWMSKMGSTLLTISEYDPSFKVVDDPSLGCQVKSEES